MVTYAANPLTMNTAYSGLPTYGGTSTGPKSYSPTTGISFSPTTSPSGTGTVSYPYGAGTSGQTSYQNPDGSTTYTMTDNTGSTLTVNASGQVGQPLSGYNLPTGTTSGSTGYTSGGTVSGTGSNAITEQTNPLYLSPAQPPLGIMENTEQRTGASAQVPINVLDVTNPLAQAIQKYREMALGIQNPDQVSLNQNFSGGDALTNALSGGIDYFGQLGISEGIQNLALQREAANRALTSALGRNPENQALIGVLQNQNAFRSQLGQNALIGEAQRGTAERASQQLALDNLQQQLINDAMLQQAGFNQQTQLASLQPYQNYLEILSALQGQGRGVTTTEAQIGTKNFE